MRAGVEILKHLNTSNKYFSGSEIDSISPDVFLCKISTPYGTEENTQRGWGGGALHKNNAKKNKIGF